jgi:hypothetical protein
LSIVVDIDIEDGDEGQQDVKDQREDVQPRIPLNVEERLRVKGKIGR